MAADTENPQELTHELIKHSKDLPGSRNGGAMEGEAKPRETERKRIVRVKKKPSVDTSSTAPSAGTEKTARKVKVIPRAAKPKNVQLKSTEADEYTSAKTATVTQAEVTAETPSPAQELEVVQATSVTEPLPALENDKPAPPSATAVKQVSVFKETARPAVQAGRVGGKFIGPKVPRSGPVHGGGSDKPPSYVGRGNARRGGGQVGQGGPYTGPRGAYSGGRAEQGGRQGFGGAAGGGQQGSSYGGGRFQGGTRPPYAGQGGTRPPYAGQGGTRPPYAGQGGTRPPYAGQGGTRPPYAGQGGTRPPYAGQGGGAYRPGGFGQTGYGSRFGPGRTTPTPPPVDNKGAIKRTFKAKKPVYQRRDKEAEMEEKLQQGKKRSSQIANPVPKLIDIMEVVSVSELARKMNLKASDLIAKLMSMGQMVSINQQIDSETAAILAAEFGADVNIVSLYDETLIETAADDADSMTPRPPVVTVMGHVDHGKTKLLDAIRSADVVSGEFGGITQHIGAYMVETPNGSITFLDTPGHEAFTRMRSRGAQVTDIVVLVVAADDGVMPQTIEAINHAKEADVPIIVAINKIDKPDANPDKVRSQLSDLGLQPEEWGGQTMFVELSALKKEGIDNLVETILLQAEILDLRVNYNRSAEGKILESRIDHGRGIVATMLVEKGVLEIGDSFVAGIWPGKVRAIFNDKGIRVDKASPSMPVEVLGFEGIPNAGDPLQVVEDEKIARSFSAKRQELKRFEDAKNIRKITLDNLYDTINDGEIQELKVIIKGDVQGSVEALRASLEELSTKEVRLAVIQALPGAINEGDVDLASASNAILIAFNVRPTPKAKSLAEQEKVDIRRYNVIYRVVEDMQKAMEGMLKPDTKEEVIADVEVREVFKISKAGVIAGCYVRSGAVKRSASVNVIRNDTVIHTGKISSLRRFKDDVKEVTAGFECGMSVDSYDDIKIGDEFEVFEIVEVARKL
ncbi:MAG: translation initiation factor IF-2 [Spirochaetaceae bacterium]|jgi:translation initiation factor IF-2|nr:translation initiation factor IF-2 [Spirochaetaceae bacterium]